MREKMRKYGKLGRLSKMEKIAYSMLSVVFLIEVIILLAAVFDVANLIAEKSIGLLLVLLVGFMCFPLFVMGFLQMLFIIIGISDCVKGKWKSARKFNVGSAVLGMVLCSVGVGYACVCKIEIRWTILVIVGIIYHIIIVTLLGICMRNCKNDMNKKYKAVLFDFDYTLGDSTDGIVQSISYALEQLNEQPQELENIRRTIGMTLKETYRTLTGNMDEERATQFEIFFKQKADEVMVAGTNLYAPTRQALEMLHGHGCKIGIVTTKYHYRIGAILEKFGMSMMIDVIVGGDDVKRQKPAPDLSLIHI